MPFKLFAQGVLGNFGLLANATFITSDASYIAQGPAITPGGGLVNVTRTSTLFNVSKQAVNPGPNFGPYGLPKAATLFLVRQYAVDYGADGIRANAVNADRVRSGLLTEDFIAERSKARGVSEKNYMSGNLLGREVTAADVAQAFLHQALELKTTGDVTTVDGGNIAAALR